MKKILALSILVSVFVLPFTQIPAGSEDITKTRGTLSVSYSTEKEVSPDTVEVSISVKTSDKKSMQEASRKNKEISNKVYDFLKSNINTSNGDYVKTSNFRATPVYVYQNNKRILDRYEVSNNVVVHTKSIDKVSSFIDKSIAFGATDVNSLNFTLSDKDSNCAQLLVTASKQVRNRADSVASALNSGVTGIKNVRTSCSLNQRRVSYGYSNMKLMRANAADGMAAEAAAPATDIEVGNITIYANVDAEFYVK